MLQKMQRKTLNLTRADVENLVPFLTSGSPARMHLGELVEEDLGSESDVFRALMKLGMRAVLERQLEVGYAELAATPDEEHEAWVRASELWAAERHHRDEP